PHLIDFFLYSLPPHSELYTLSLHDALPICGQALRVDQSVINAYVQSVSRDGESLGCSGLSVCPLIFGLDMRRWEVLKQRRCADVAVARGSVRSSSIAVTTMPAGRPH